MPVTTGYSADPEKNYTEKSSLINATSFTSQDLRTSAGAHSSPNGSISSYSRTNSVDSLDDSQSSSSGGSASGHSRQVSNDSTTGSSDYIPTRSIKQASKPQHNALQFVKIGSCPLYKKATEQMKKAEEVKKMKTVARQDEEDWQHNLDNWKSKRRQSCQKSQERADELRRLEEEEFNFQDKGRRKSKTFSEMVEQRSKRGRNFGYFSDEWDDTDSGTKGGSWDGSDSPRHDLSMDSTSSDPVFRDDESSDTSSVDRNHPETSESKTKENGLQLGEENGNTGNNQEHKSPVNGCENGEAEENGENNANPFEKAIQSYVQFAESQKKTLNHEKKAVNGNLAHKSKKYTDEENIISKTIPEENGSTEEKANGTIFSGDRTGGAEMLIVVTLKSGSEHRDFGFTTKGQGRGLVFVEAVSSRGPAETAGLRPDDEVLAINGESVTNRSHSAIVFAIKQALYTGRLELGIYRYNNANQIPKQGMNNVSTKKPSRIEEKRAVFTRDNSNEKEPSPDKRILREKSPKVDIVKRRSLFESPPKELGEIQQQRRSLDASTALKNKILSFENLENIDKMTKPSEGKRQSAKQKKQPLEKQNGTDRKSDFMKRLSSFENLESVGNNSYGTDIIRSSPERKQSLKEKIGVFEKPEMFERSRSCDFLNTDHRNDRCLMSPLSNQGNLNDSRIQSPQDETASENSFDWDSVDNDNYSDDPVGPPRIIDVVTKEESPEPAKLINETRLKTKSTEILSNTSIPLNSEAKDDTVRNHLPEEKVKQIPEEKKIVEVLKKTVLPPVEDAEVNTEFLNKNSALYSKSPFELAETLEETSFVGSNPSSPDWKNTTKFTVPDVTKQNVCNGEETNTSKNNYSRDEVGIPIQLSMEHEIEPLDMTHLGEELYIVDDFDFDAPPRVCEPPKEKPPPPPIESDISFDQVDSKGTQLKRVDSTKRIKQELQRLRSDFLGFDSTSETNYLDLENLTDLKGDNSNSSERKLSNDLLEDLASLKLEQPKWEDKVDSVESPKELEDVFYPDDKMNEEDEIARKEKEIIEDLEREEQMKKLKHNDIYKVENEPHQKTTNNDVGSLEVENKRLEDEKRRQEEERKLREREEQLRQQEEVLRLEKEKLRKEQEELMKQREEYQRQIQEYQLMHPPFLPPVVDSKTSSIPQQSLNDDGLQADFVEYAAKSVPVESQSRMPKKEVKVNNNGSSLVKSSPPESKVVEETFSKSIHSPPEVQLGFPDEETPPHRKLPDNPPISAPKISSHVAVPPKSKLVNNNEKCPVRRKPDTHSKNSYNQHWLIQEAEMRRISEQQDRLRQARSPTRESINEGKQFPDRTKPMTNPSSYSQRPQLTQNNYFGKSMNYASHQGQQKRPVVSSHEQFSSRSPDYVEVQTTNPLLPSKNSVQNPVGSLANGDPHMLSVSGKKKCSHCGDELGKGAAMIIESLHLFYHIQCFKCCVCHVQLGNGLSGADVRVRNQKLHCHNCYSNDEAGLKFSKV